MDISKLVNRFLRSEYVESRAFGSTSDDWISDAARMARCDDAAANGADGSTHAEHIQDMRDAWEAYLRDRRAWTNVDRVDAAVCAHFDALEAWHEAAGSLHEQVG